MSQTTDRPFPPRPEPQGGASQASSWTAGPPAPAASPAPSGASAGRGVVPLRPLMPGEILDGAVTAMRARPGIMLGLSAVVVACAQALALPLDYLYLRFLSGLVDDSTSQAAARGINDLTAFRPGAMITVLTVALLAGLLTTTVSRAVLGRSATLGEVWAATRPKLLRLVGLAVVLYLVIFGSVVLAIAPGVLLLLGGQAIGALLVFFGVIGGAVFALNRAVAWMLASAALVLEDQSIRKALRRSSLLVKGSWWRVFGIWLLALLVVALVVGSLAAVEQYVVGSQVSPVTDHGDGTYSGHAVSLGSMFLSAVFGTAIQSLLAPFLAAVTTLQYVDRRMRREALDIQLARSARATPPDGPRTAT